jgi:glutamyl-tRNA synthetase
VRTEPSSHTGNSSALGAIRKPGRPHLTRWFSHVDTLPVPRAVVEHANKARSDLEKGKKAKRTESVDVVLPNAVPGKVVVRFGELPGSWRRLGRPDVQRPSRRDTSTLVTSRRLF